MMQKSKHLYFLFLLLALLWSGSFLGIKITVEAAPPIFCAMLRVATALLCLTCIFTLTRKKLFAPFSLCWRLWVTGLFTMGLPFALLFYGEQFIAPALAGILNSTVPIWAFILCAIFFRQQSTVTTLKIIGLFLGFIGVITIFWPILQHDQQHSALKGIIAVLGMAISYAIGAILNQRLVTGNKKPPFYVSLWQQSCSSLIFLLMISLLFEHWPTLAVITAPKVLGAFLYLGVLSTALAWIIYFHLIRQWDAVRASSVMYLAPVFAIGWDYLFLHLAPTLQELLGAVTILCGVMLIQYQRKKV